MGAPWRVLMCLPTLLDLLQNPEKSSFSNPRNFKQRVAELKSLQESIDSGKVLVYVPPALVSYVHFAINSQFGIENASEYVRKLLGFAVCNLDVDYDSILQKANASIHGLGNSDLYDVIGLACAEALNANAFITDSKSIFRQIVDSNYRNFPEFSVHIMNVSEFVRSRTYAEIQYRSDENSVYVFTPQLEEIKGRI
jgi:hypothetical protein